MTNHHPSDATLIAYAAGTLPVLHGKVLAVHLAQCAACQATLQMSEELGGVVLDAMIPVPLAEDALTHAFARLETAEPAIEPAPPPATTLEALSRGGRWRRVGPGVRLMPLVPRDATGTRLDLVRVAPGVSLPRHDHRGHELTCVLKGAFVDQTGEYHFGDLAEGDVGLDHQPRTLDGEECICLIATTGYLRAHSLFTRLLQPIFGI